MKYENTNPEIFHCSNLNCEFHRKDIIQHYHDEPKVQMFNGKIYCIKCHEFFSLQSKKSKKLFTFLIRYIDELLKKYPGHFLLTEMVSKIESKPLEFMFNASKYYKLVDDCQAFDDEEKEKLRDLIFKPFKQEDVRYISTRKRKKN